MQKTFTRQFTPENNCYATCDLMTTSICWEAVKKNSQQLTERLQKTAATYDMEISFGQIKILVNSMKPRPSSNIWANRKALEEVDQFRYLGSTQTKD